MSAERRVFHRRPLLAPPARFRLRLRAWLAAGADRRHDVLAAVDADRLDPLLPVAGRPSELETFYVARNRAEFHQADEQDLRMTSALLAPEVRRLGRLVEERRSLLDELSTVADELERLEARERPSLGTIRRTAAEQGASDATVLARREAAHDAPVAALRRLRSSLRADLRRLDAESAEIAAGLDAAFRVQLTRSRMLRAHYEACAELYRRRLTHRRPTGAVFQAAAMATTTIPAPPWNDEPNPWIPAGFAALESEVVA